MTRRTVADVLRDAIAASPLTQREIATRAGFRRQTVIAMMASGATRVPLDRAVPLARTLEIEPAEFLRLALAEYHPDILKALAALPEDDEVRLVKMYRQANQGNIKLDENFESALKALFYLAERAGRPE